MSSEEKTTFNYFAYGSNLLTERIRINNPSARSPRPAKLFNYQLDFDYFSKRWNGAVATIIPSEGKEMWGILWELDMSHLATLDKQEGVPRVYNRIEVEVTLESGEKEKAFTYFLVKPKETDKRPSQVYLNVIQRGAKEHPLPDHYIELLSRVEHNGYGGEVDVNLDLAAISKKSDE